METIEKKDFDAKVEVLKASGLAGMQLKGAIEQLAGNYEVTEGGVVVDIKALIPNDAPAAAPEADETKPMDGKAVGEQIAKAVKDALGELKQHVPQGGKPDVQVIEGKSTTFAKAEDAYVAGLFVQALCKNANAESILAKRYGMNIKMDSVNNSAGAVFAPTQLYSGVIVNQEKYGKYRANVNPWPMDSDKLDVPRHVSDATVYHVTDGATITESDIATDSVELVTKTLASLIPVSNKLLSITNQGGIIRLGDFIAESFGRALAKAEDLSGFIGDGTSTYFGFTGLVNSLKNLGGTYANTAGLQVATGTGYGTNWASVTVADIAALIGRLPEYALGGAKFYCSQAFYGQVLLRLKVAGGGNTIPTLGAGGLQYDFLGFPVVITQVMPSASAVNQVALLFGDLQRSSKMGQQQSMQIATSTEYGFATNETYFRAIEDIAIVNHDVGNYSATAASRIAGPMCGLITASS